MSSKRTEKQRRRKRRSDKKADRIERRLAGFDRSDRGPSLGTAHIDYEVAERVKGLSPGGIGAIDRLVKRIGLPALLNDRVQVLKIHAPYHESDHILSLAYNLLCGGRSPEDLERLRNDEAYLDALGVETIPDPTTAGDFCRRFQPEDVEALMGAVNEARLQVWGQQPEDFFEEAWIDADGTLAPTTGECKQGMGLSYKGVWGYHPLLISLANTNEPLFLVNRSGNRPSSEGAAARLDDALDLCRRAGFRNMTLRGDTDFSQVKHLDRWVEENVGILFGFDACPNLVSIAQNLPRKAWQILCRSPRSPDPLRSRRPRQRVKDQIVEQKGYRNLVLDHEDIAEFEYCPTGCKRSYRMVVVRKTVKVLAGQHHLFDEVRYFFYITNRRDLDASQVVVRANQRCNQERLIEQLKNGAGVLRMPLGDLVSNAAYMVIASLAWTLKAWLGLVQREEGPNRETRRRDKRILVEMSFRRFVEEIIRVPAQIIRTGRRIVHRLLGWTRYQPLFLRVLEVLDRPMLA